MQCRQQIRFFVGIHLIIKLAVGRGQSEPFIFMMFFLDKINERLIIACYMLNAIFIPAIVIPVPIIARINPIIFPITVIKLFPIFLTIGSLKEKAK